MSVWGIEDVRANIEESIRRHIGQPISMAVVDDVQSGIGRVYEFTGEAVSVGENEIRLLEVEWLSTLAVHPDIVAHRVYKLFLRGEYIGDFTAGEATASAHGWRTNAAFYPRCPAECVELKMELPRQE